MAVFLIFFPKNTKMRVVRTLSKFHRRDMIRLGGDL